MTKGKQDTAATANCSTAPAVVAGSLATLDYTDAEMLKVLRATVAVGATDAEFAFFIEYCKSTGLNPWKRECWCIIIPEKKYTKRNGEQGFSPRQVQIMTGINGYFAIANSDPQYDGMEVETERDEAGKPRHVTVKAYRKDRSRPSVGEAWIDEDAQFMGGYGVWDKRPSTLLAKVAKARALRECFSQKLGISYTPEEMPPEYSLDEPATNGLPTPQQRQEEKAAAKLAIGEAEKREVIDTASYRYDLQKMYTDHPEADKRKAVYALGAASKPVREGGIAHTLEPVPGWEQYLIRVGATDAAGEEDLPEFLK